MKKGKKRLKESTTPSREHTKEGNDYARKNLKEPSNGTPRAESNKKGKAANIDHDERTKTAWIKKGSQTAVLRWSAKASQRICERKLKQRSLT